MTFNEIINASDFFELTRTDNSKCFVSSNAIFLIYFLTKPNGYTRVQFFDGSFIYVLETLTDFREILLKRRLDKS